MVNQLVCFLREEKGAIAIEYSLMASLIAAVIVGTVATLGGSVSTTYTAVNTVFS